MGNGLIPAQNGAKSKASIAKAFAIIAFCLVMAALTGAIVCDIAVVGKAIFMFFAAVLLSAFAFIIAFVLFILSCMLIFGVYLLDTYGFWPLTFSANFFGEIMKDAVITDQARSIFIAVRILCLILCVLAFIFAIVALSNRRRAKKAGFEQKQKLSTSFGIISLLLSVFGVFASLIMLLIFSIR